MPARILILGHTGVEKELAVRNLAQDYLSGTHGLAAGLEHVRHREFLRAACLEDFLPDIRAFLDSTNEEEAGRLWMAALDEAVRQLEDGPPNAHLVLSLHGSYYRRARAFSRADLEAISQQFRPTVVVVLIDDVFDVAEAIALRDPQDSLRLRELATWRSIEGMIGDFIARPLRIHSYTIAVKHPVSMVSQLLFGEGVRAYSAFPITRTRADPAARKEIEDFKESLRQEGIILFDPSTIDEMLLRQELDAAPEGEAEITVDLGKRWDLAARPLLVEGRAGLREQCAMTFPKGEIEEVTQDIRTQIESRDFRMIQDSHCLIAYRPNWGGSASRGVTAELYLARGIGRRIFVYSPNSDEAAGDSPFQDFGSVYREHGELVVAVKRLDVH